MSSMQFQISLVSTGSSGNLGNYHSGYNSLSISQDGNLVAFYTYADNLFSPDPYGSDYAIKDIQTGSIVSLTQSVNGSLLNGESGGAVAGYDTLSMSSNGLSFVFGSSSNLMSTNDGSDEDIFLLSRSANQLALISDAQGGIKTSHAMTPDVSDNGLFIVFEAIDNLVAPNDINGIQDTDVYWYDTANDQLRLVSGEFDGSFQGGGSNQEGDSWNAHVTNDGRFVVFNSNASNLRLEATGGASKQLFLRDMVNDQLYLISTGFDGAPANGNCETPEITPDGRYVVFGSSASNLVSGVSGWNIFRLDMYSSNIEVVNDTQSGQVADGAFNPELTPDGRYVVFESTNRDLVPGTSGTGTQIYVKDMVTKAISMVSTTANGSGGSNSATGAQISDDGQFIVFNTRSQLSSEDTNDYDDVYRVSNPIYASGTDSNNDTFANSPEGETFSGGTGLDTVVYAWEYANYSLSKGGDSFNINLLGVTDQLSSIERLIFWDISVALDLDGNAGKTAKILGAVFGASSVSNKEYVGIGLSLLDEGMSYEDLTALAINVTGATTPQQVVTLLWTNVVGSAPTADQAQPFVEMLNGGMTIGQLGVLASDTDLNQANINLIGLAQTGLEFI